MEENEYHSADYWNARYRKDGRLFDFYAYIGAFCPYFEQFLAYDSKILILGAGTSREAFQLYDKGFRNIVALDFAEEARNAVREHLNARPEIDYRVADIATFDSEQKFDFMFDKGTLDCVLADPEEPEDKLRAVLSNLRDKMTFKTTWCSVTFDSARDELIEEAAPGAFRIEVNDLRVEVYGMDQPQKMYCYSISRRQ